MPCKVYLAGGMRKDWRSKVKSETDNLVYFDPCESGFHDPVDYTVYDLLAVKNCDILLGYMEQDNSSGIGLALEIGYARALNKTVILIDEKNDRYMGIVRNSSDIVATSLNDAIAKLKILNRLFQ